MEYILLLTLAVAFLLIGIAIGVHNAKSSTVAPLARSVQELGRKAVKTVKSTKKK